MLITKMDAAVRLTKMAIRGHIRGDDPLNVHLSTFSALSVLSDLRKARGMPRLILQDSINPEHLGVFFRAFFKINNFLKHADKDPEATVDIGKIEHLNDMGLLVVLESLRSLGFDLTEEFWLSFFYADAILRNPDSIDQKASAEWTKGATKAWADLDHDVIVEMARNPDPYREETQAMMELVKPGMRL